MPSLTIAVIAAVISIAILCSVLAICVAEIAGNRNDEI